MKKIKSVKNSSGFTLIELIISMAILSILVTGVFAFLSSANEHYSDTKSFNDFNSSSSLICDYMTDILRYTDAILVLEDYDGIPQAIDGYSHCFIIDENNCHASADSVEGRKNLTGRILRASLSDGSGGYVDIADDLSNARVILGDSIFGDFFYEYDIEAYKDGISLDIFGYVPMKASGASYVPDYETTYTAKMTIESLNLKHDPNVDVLYYQFDVSSSYGAFPQQAGTAGKKYTYIFYNLP